MPNIYRVGTDLKREGSADASAISLVAVNRETGKTAVLSTAYFDFLKQDEQRAKDILLVSKILSGSNVNVMYENDREAQDALTRALDLTRKICQEKQ